MQSQAAKSKETRNLNDKNCVQEMIKNISEFLNHQYLSFQQSMSRHTLNFSLGT